MPGLDIDYTILAVDSLDVPITGLSPIFTQFRKVKDESVVIQPTITEMTNPPGNYKFTFDWEGKLVTKDEDIIFRIDLGASVQNRFIDGRISPRDLGISAVTGQLGLLRASVTWKSSGTPIQGVVTEIRDNSDTNDLILGLVSDGSGIVNFALPANNPSLSETYKVRGFKAAVDFSAGNPYSIELLTDGQNFDLAAIQTTIGLPTPPATTRLFDFALKPDGVTPLKAITATLEIISLPFDSGDELHEGDEIPPDNYNSATGEVRWDVVQGATVRIKIKELGLNKKIVVPVAPNPARITDEAGI